MMDLSVTVNANSVTVAAMINDERVHKVYACYDTVGECVDAFLEDVVGCVDKCKLDTDDINTKEGVVVVMGYGSY